MLTRFGPLRTSPRRTAHRPVSRTNCVARAAAMFVILAPAAVAQSVLTRFTPLPGPHAAIPGRTLVVPLVEESATSARRGAPAGAQLPVVRFGSGQPVPVRVFRISPVGITEPPRDAPLRFWLGPSMRWQSQEVLPGAGASDPKGRSGGGAESPQQAPVLLLIPIPEGAAGVPMFVNDRSVALAWFDPPPPSTGSAIAPRPLGDAASMERLGEALLPQWSDPLARWRVRLLLDRLPTALVWPRGAPPDRFDDPALDAIARQSEDRWRVGVEEIRRVDPRLSEEVVHRLTAVVRLPQGALVPAWPTDDSATGELHRVLLDTTIGRTKKADSTRAWLASLPEAHAWVIDDGGAARRTITETASEQRARRATLGALEEPVIEVIDATVGVTELQGRRADAMVSQTEFGASPGLVVAPHESAALPASARALPGTPVGQVWVRLGGWAERLGVVARPLEVEPPGLRLGPLVSEWTHASWLTGVPLMQPPSAVSAGLLQRSTSGTTWEVVVECHWPPSDNDAGRGDAEPDRVVLWFGPYRGPRIAIEIGPDGQVSHPLGASVRFRVACVREPGRWVALVEIPRAAFEPDGGLLIGLERRDPEGRRWSWPRPMLPGQSEPGRAAIDVSTWGSLAPAPE